MKFRDFIRSLNTKGDSIFPGSSALSLYSGKQPFFLEVYSTADFLELIREGYTHSFLQHPCWDVFFELDDAFISYKTVSPARLQHLRYHAESPTYPIFSYQLPSGTYLDPCSTRFNLKYEKEAGSIISSSLYHYLKYLMISGEHPEYNLSVHYNFPEIKSRPHLIEWHLFNHLLAHKSTPYFLSQMACSSVLFLFFPQLQILQEIEQDKDYHPEGNVFEHTLACFQYVKNPSLTLSLGLLFHDLGKAFARRNNRKHPFYKHSSIGAYKARKALSPDIYPARIREDVFYLVRYHMYPPFLFYRSTHTIKRIVEHPAFKKLLKLYRADLLSTYQGSETYQRVLKQYKEYKNNLTRSLHVLD